MKRKIFFTTVTLLIFKSVLAQSVCNDFYHKKFTVKELSDDLNFIKEKILDTHINPFTEISREQFENNIKSIRASLKEGMTQKDFYFLVMPLFVNLNDEHSRLNDFCVTDSIRDNFRVFPLRFRYSDQKVILTENYSSENLHTGDELLAINDIPVEQIMDDCSAMACGITEDRKKAVIARLWLYLPKFCFFITDNYRLRFRSGIEVTVRSQTWDEYNANVSRMKPAKNTKKELLRFDNINGVGYLTINSFSTRKMPIDSWKKKIDSVFCEIKTERIGELFVDVSNNGGGDSAVGDILIDYFSDKAYKTYSGKWKKSSDYLNKLTELTIEDDEYERAPNGEIILLNQSIVSPSENPNRFTGPVYVVAGKNTFSSAMMFAVTVLDNKLATVIGEVPEWGHPNHFGEVIDFKTPSTQLGFQFSVKEWIRPSGERENNVLVPDIPVVLEGKSQEAIIEAIK